MVVLLLGSTGLLGAAVPKQAWLWAILVGAGIPLVGIVIQQNAGSLIALGIAFIGAYGGVLLRKAADGLRR